MSQPGNDNTPPLDDVLERNVAREYAAGFVTDVESDTLPPGLDEDVPDGEGVLAAADGDEYAIVGSEHVVVLDRLLDLSTAQLLEVLGTEVRVVPRQIDHRRLTAHPALAADGSHRSPPEITGRTSTTSS